MKQAVSILLIVGLLCGLTGCAMGGDTSSYAVASVNTGLGSVHSMSVTPDNVTVKSTVAAVLMGEDGRIRACQLDEMVSKATLDNGKVVLDPDTRTNSEKLYEYGLAATSPIGREWFEQASAFGDYVIGLTADEVASLPLSDGRVKDAGLSSRCELDVTDFVAAITQAARSAAPLGASREDTLSVAMSRTNETGSDDRRHAAVQVAAVTVNPSGVVSSCLIDVAETQSRVTDGAFTGQSGAFATNKGKRNDLMIETESSESVGWFEQAAAFEKYVTGKTLTQIKATPLTGGRAAADTELAKTCFIPVSALLDTLIKAIEVAGTTGETATPLTTTTADHSQESSENLLDRAESAVNSMMDEAEDILSDVLS